MNCSVCGKEFGLWARVTGDAADAICRDCEQEGPKQIGKLFSSVAPTADLRTLAALFEETASKYKFTHAKLGEYQASFLEKLALATAEKEEISDEDVHLINDIASRFNVKTMFAGSAAGRALLAINARQALRGWQSGEVPSLNCKGLLLRKGEICHWEEPSRLFEERTRRHYVGGYGGVSVRAARGVRIHTGAFKGVPIETPELRERGGGILHISSQRVAFTGSLVSTAFDLKRIISVMGFEDGFKIFRSGAKKPLIVQVENPELTLQLLAMATPAEND